MLDGNYSFRATVEEVNSDEKYPFTMNLSIENNIITGDVNYFNDGCLGNITGQILSSTQLKLFETITQGKSICDNGIYLYDLKYQIIFKANSYTLEKYTHHVTINSYTFIPKEKTWNNILLKEDINRTKANIETLENNITQIRTLIEETYKQESQSKRFLEHNSSAFIDGQCIEPPLATPKPKPFFETKEKAKHYALAYCSVSFGCRVGVELARDKLDTGAKRFLASQGCSLLVRTYQEDNTLLDETMFNLLDAVSYAGCEDEADGIFSAILKGGSCVMSTATRLTRVGQYMHCIDYKTEEFHNSYLDWKDEPTKKKMQCDRHVKVVSETPKIIAKYHEEISMKKNKIDLMTNQLTKLNNDLKEVTALRVIQNKLMEKLHKE